MSQCIRNASNRFITVNSLLNSRKPHVTQFDRQLPHRIKPSKFLEEFLNTRTVTSAAVSQKCKLRDPALPSSLSVLNNCDAWRAAFDPEYAVEKEKESEIKLSVDSNNHPRASHASSLNSIIMSGIKRYEISSDDIVAWEKISRYEDSQGLIMLEAESLEKTYSRLSNGITLLRTNNSILSDFEKSTILLAETGKLNTERMDTRQSNPDNEGKPSHQQLEYVYNTLKKTIPNIFTRSVDYTIYDRDIHFINNIRGTVTRGLIKYIQQMALFRIIAHFRFAYVKLEVLKMTLHPEDDTIKIRWRIRGISTLKTLFLFWKVRFWAMRDNTDQHELWYDGFSTFYVNGDGLIYKHVADKVMPDKDETVRSKDQAEVAAKLALFWGLLVPGGETFCEMCLLTAMSRHNRSLVTQLNCDTNLLDTDLISLEKVK